MSPSDTIGSVFAQLTEREGGVEFPLTADRVLYLSDLSLRGECKASLLLGIIHIESIKSDSTNTVHDASRALYFLRDAADGGISEAVMLMASVFDLNITPVHIVHSFVKAEFDIDFDVDVMGPVISHYAHRLYQEAAEDGNVHALFYIALNYLHGRAGACSSPAIALHFLRRAARLGHVASINALNLLELRIEV
jgi:TPR repeat protein